MKPTQRLRETDLAFALLRAAFAVDGVLLQGMSLTRALQNSLEGIQTPTVRATISDLAYFGMRHAGLSQTLWPLLSGRKQLQPPDLEAMLGLVLSLLWVNTPNATPPNAIPALQATVQAASVFPHYAAHTLVNQAVIACASHRPWLPAKGLVNACLRSFLREPNFWRQQVFEQTQHAVWNAPAWWVQTLQQQHPNHWQNLLMHSAGHPPMVLRVNRQHATAQQYSATLSAAGHPNCVLGPQAIHLYQPCPVAQLPGFMEGHVSVQDLSAQLAVPLLNPCPGQRVLDACAAPGGKTGHLLEWNPIHLTALDCSAPRLAKVQATIDRLAPSLENGWSCTLKQAQAQNLASWWDGQSFDAVLADVPCSGSGVVRRHPDIPWLRRPQDLHNLADTQLGLVQALWQTVKPGGTLVLCTCSVFAEEGPHLAAQLARLLPNAEALTAPGWVLPKAKQGENHEQVQGDGFFYARFIKQANEATH